MIIYSKKYNTYYEVLIDKDDYKEVSKYRWGIRRYIHTNYCKTHHPHFMQLHRLVMKYHGSEFQIDHINKNGLDNRKKNLRTVTASINTRNTHKKGKTSVWLNTIWVKNINGFVVRYRDFESKPHSKYFGINKYGGKASARHHAILFSIEKRKQYGYILTDDDYEYLNRCHLIIKKKKHKVQPL